MSALLAKKQGAKKAIVLIQKYAYINLLSNNAIDIYISPGDATISALLTNIRRNGITNVKTLKHRLAEGLEIKLTGDYNHSYVIGRYVKDIKLPLGISICAIARGDEMLIPDDKTIFQNNDTVVFFVSEKKNIRDLIKLTSPKATFFSSRTSKSN